MLEPIPLVSTIIPVYNRQKYIAEAIGSVLEQTYSPIEIIVIDDGSTDNSCRVVKSFTNDNLHYYFQTNQGQSAARNHGVNQAHGDFYAFLDSDDLWLPDKIDRQVQTILNDPQLDMVFGGVVQFLDDGLEMRSSLDFEKIPGIVPSTLFVKRKSFHKIGPFSSKWKVGEFIDWYSRAVEFGLKSQILPDVVAKRRIHRTNIGIVERKSQKEYLYILKESLERKRNKS